MKKATKAVVRNAMIVAAELYDIRREENELKKINKELSDELRALMKAGQVQEYYQLRKDYTLAIADPEKALLWASIHNCLKIDLPLVDKKLKAERLGLPAGYAIKESEKLVEISAAKEKDENFIIEG